MFTSRIGAYHDGELEGEIRHNLEAHLATCGQCRTELDSVRQMSTLLGAGKVESLSINEIRTVRGQAEGLAEGPPLQLFGGIMAAAASILIVCGAWWRTLPPAGPAGTSPAIARRELHDWEKVMYTLRVDPPTYTTSEATAVADAKLADWMLAELSSSKEGLHDGN